MKVRLKALIAICCMLPGPVMAKGENADDDSFTHHRAAVTGMLNSSDSYDLRLSYHYMIWKYLGAGGGVGFWRNYFVDGHASGPGWNIDYDNDHPWNFYLSPSLVIKSPALRIKQVYLSLYAEPGLMLNIPYARVCIEKTQGLQVYDYDYVSTNRGQWLAWDVHAGVNLDVGPIGVSIGYMMSNLDIYSYFRHLKYDGVSFSEFYPKKTNFIQGVYLTVSFNLEGKSSSGLHSKRKASSNPDTNPDDPSSRMRHVEWEK